jgi:glycosyltransferase involved in cell wall biosynthesis
MRAAKKQVRVADALAETCERLRALAKDPLSTSAASSIDAVVEELSEAEAWLRTDAERRAGKPARKRRRRLRRLGVLAKPRSGVLWKPRIGVLWKPRIGVLRQHEPRRLVVPRRYLLEDPPLDGPTISLVTPSFQQGAFLARTLYSVVSQNYPNLEYIVQDGGSTDETAQILRRFEHLLLGWTSDRDEGQADAINRGFARTTGEIMGFLNSDDLLLPGALAHVANYFSRHPDVDVVYGNRILIDEEDREIGMWVLPGHDDRALTLVDFVPQETLFWRRPMWDAIGSALDTGFGYALDWDLLLRMQAARARIVHLPRFLGAFRVHGQQKSTATLDVGLAECERLRRREHGRNMSQDELIARLRPYLRRHFVAHALTRGGRTLSLRNSPVRTVPLEAWLREPNTSEDEPRAGERVLPLSASPEAPSRPR